MKWIFNQVNKFYLLVEKMRCLAIKNTIRHGKDFSLRLPQLVVHPENVNVGESVYINRGLVALAYSSVRIGDAVMLGPCVSLLTSGHDPDLSGLDAQESVVAKPIEIGPGAWIGASVVILGGVTIGAGAVVGAGSVVTKNVPENSIAVGNPCRVIRKKE